MTLALLCTAESSSTHRAIFSSCSPLCQSVITVLVNYLADNVYKNIVITYNGLFPTAISKKGVKI